MVPSKFGVNWPFGSGEEAKNRFSRWRPWRPSWISDRNDFSYFWSTSHPEASYQVSSQLAQGCRRSRLLKQLLTPHDGRRTLTDHNSSPWALRAQVSSKQVLYPEIRSNAKKKLIDPSLLNSTVTCLMMKLCFRSLSTLIIGVILRWE